jgi:hypothetical protein
MTDSSIHLPEGERHLFVDGELAPKRMREIAAHLAACHACASDVARIERFITSVRDARGAATRPFAVDELWPSIQSRVEAQKIAAITSADSQGSHHDVQGSALDRTSRLEPRRLTRRQTAAILTAAMATLVVALVVAPLVYRATRPPALVTTESNTAPANQGGPMLTAAADSERLYEEETQLLLNRLELERSMLRPETVRSLDHDLRVIDQAIAELKLAVARDPRNAALHQLLASSYRQKAELLKRVANAG